MTARRPARTRASGVRRLVIPAVDAAHWGTLLALCRREPGLYPALGLHPVYLEQHCREDVDALEGAVAQHRHQEDCPDDEHGQRHEEPVPARLTESRVRDQ